MRGPRRTASRAFVLCRFMAFSPSGGRTVLLTAPSFCENEYGSQAQLAFGSFLAKQSRGDDLEGLLHTVLVALDLQPWKAAAIIRMHAN